MCIRETPYGSCQWLMQKPIADRGAQEEVAVECSALNESCITASKAQGHHREGASRGWRNVQQKDIFWSWYSMAHMLLLLLSAIDPSPIQHG